MPKQKILILSSGLRIGGVERSLIGLLDSFDYERYEVSLFLWQHDGELMPLIPPQVRLLPQASAYSRLEVPIKHALFSSTPGIGLARLFAKLVTAVHAKFLKTPGFLLPRSVRYCLPFLPAITGEYDLAINFLTPHDIVTQKTTARTKIGWIHTDYSTMECGVDKRFELPMWQKLDTIAAVSEQVRSTFLQVFPELTDKVIVIENILSVEFVRQQAAAVDVSAEMPAEPGVVRLCSVGRFCHPKNFDSIPEIVRMLGEIRNWKLESNLQNPSVGSGLNPDLSGRHARSYRVLQVALEIREAGNQAGGQEDGSADHGTAPRWSSHFSVCKETETGHSCPVKEKSGLENPGSVIGCDSAAPSDPWSNQDSATLHPNSKSENRKSKISIKWYLIGYGGDETLIRQKIAEAGVGDQVIILGKKTNPYPYMKACDLYVQPSRYEGKAVTVREAQMLGKPVLITNFPTAKSQLEDNEDGLICPLDNAAIADAIRRLIEDRELRNRLAQTAAARDYSNAGEVEKIYRLVKESKEAEESKNSRKEAAII